MDHYKYIRHHAGHTRIFMQLLTRNEGVAIVTIPLQSPAKCAFSASQGTRQPQCIYTHCMVLHPDVNETYLRCSLSFPYNIEGNSSCSW